MEVVEDTGLKFGIYSHLHEHMKITEHKMQGHSLSYHRNLYLNQKYG